MRIRFTLKTVFLWMLGAAIACAWFAPGALLVVKTEVQFGEWRPEISNQRIRTNAELLEAIHYVVGRVPSDLAVIDERLPNLTHHDLIPIPLNGLAGQPTAAERIPELSAPAHLEFHDTPFRDAVEQIKERCDCCLQVDLKHLWESGFDLDTPIRFSCHGRPLSQALKDMLAPLKLTYVIRDCVGITSIEAVASEPYLPTSLVSNGSAYFYVPELNTRQRLRGRLVLITSFRDETGIDSRSFGLAIPDYAQVVFVTDRTADLLDGGVVLLVFSMLAAGLMRGGVRPAKRVARDGKQDAAIVAKA